MSAMVMRVMVREEGEGEGEGEEGGGEGGEFWLWMRKEMIFFVPRVTVS